MVLRYVLLSICVAAVGSCDSNGSNGTTGDTASPPSTNPRMSESPAPPIEPASFGGEWGWSTEHEGFDLRLEQSGTMLKGHHTATAMDGARTDNVQPEDPPSISGTIEGNIATVEFTSGYSEVKGRAQMTLEGDSITWRIITVGEGEHFLPEKAVLRRNTAAKPEQTPGTVDTTERAELVPIVGVRQNDGSRAESERRDEGGGMRDEGRR